MNINHAYPVTMLLDRDYVKRVNDSPDSAIHNTFSHFAAFFIVAVTKRFNVDRVVWHIGSVVIQYTNICQGKGLWRLGNVHAYIYVSIAQCNMITQPQGW